MKKQIVTVIISAGLLLGSCATIVGDKVQTVPIASVPSEASVIIIDEKGTAIFKGATPTIVTLQKSDGSYWGGKRYVVKISKNGYIEQEIPIKTSPNGWYIGGNLIFGGFGWFIVDPDNGAMYTLSPETVSASLQEEAAHNNNAEDGGISIMLLQDVPIALRGKMQQLN